MSASTPVQDPQLEEAAEDDLLAAEDAAEEILKDDDQPMDDEDEDGYADGTEDDLDEEIQLQNDSAAHFDTHTDSVFCLAQHPLIPSLIVTGGGDDCAHLFDASLVEPASRPVLPPSYETEPAPRTERPSIPSLQRLDGHTDSVNAVTFTQPSGDYVMTAGLDGKLRAWSSSKSSKSALPTYTFLSESSEVQEINWLAACPSSAHPDTIALGASDGSVWVYSIDVHNAASPLSISQVYYLHTESCTAGCWTPDGNLLATVSEDSSLHIYDVWGEAANAGAVAAPPSISGGGRAIISLTASDQRFAVPGGLYSIAISPGGTIAAVGGADGQIRVISLPRLVNNNNANTTSTRSSTKASSQATTKKPSKPAATTTNTPTSTPNNPGTLLATLSSQSDSIETLSFSPPPLTLLASGSVDGTIALFDVSRNFALRRQIRDAHAGYAVVQIGFSASSAHCLTSVGMDGVVRRWDCRGTAGGGGGGGTTTSTSGTSNANANATLNTAAVKTGGTGTATDPSSGLDRDQGLIREWKGHRGGGEGGGILAFVQAGAAARTDFGVGVGVGVGVDGAAEEEERIITAGDDGVVLVFGV